jgi:hypothetical protein
MASVQVLPLGNYPNQSRTLGPIDIADDVTSCDISVQRCTTATPTIWPNVTTVLANTPQVSVDGGATWIEAGASVSPGGISTFRGVEVAWGISGGSLPPAVNGITRQYRVNIVITGGPCRTSATFEVN